MFCNFGTNYSFLIYLLTFLIYFNECFAPLNIVSAIFWRPVCELQYIRIRIIETGDVYNFCIHLYSKRSITLDAFHNAGSIAEDTLVTKGASRLTPKITRPASSNHLRKRIGSKLSVTRSITK